MKIIQGQEAAKATLLKRLPLGFMEAPPYLKQQIKNIFGRELSPDEVVEQIIQKIRSEGDKALFEYSERIDKVKLERLEVTRDEIAKAYEQIDKELLKALKLAAERIFSFHQKQKDFFFKAKGNLGEGLTQVITPLERVGIYAPGGKASYPSTVLMTAIPAKAAGVREIILATPPGPDGEIPSPTLAAAELAGVDRIFKIGGAQAIAALAFGTQSVPKVDKICGPGNIFVMLAKKKVFGEVGIDGLQGPTETLILADDSANPSLCAADLLAQAEHDELASAILLTTSPELAGKVNAEVERQLAGLERKEIARKSLEERGGIVVVNSLAEAIELANFYAPEHLCLMVRDAQPIVAQIKHAGGIFVGENSPEVLGDYVAGPSHVMPTGGTARFSSALNVVDFLKITGLVALNEESLKNLGPAAALIAKAEGLTAHAAAVEKRLGSF